VGPVDAALGDAAVLRRGEHVDAACAPRRARRRAFFPSAFTAGIRPSAGSTTIDVRSVETPLSPFSTIQIELS
jgi:hypothetical protein